MGKYSVSRAEQETVIRWDQEEQVVHLWSANPATWRNLARLQIAESRPPSTVRGHPVGRWWTVPLAHFRWGLKRKGRAVGRPFPRKPAS